MPNTVTAQYKCQTHDCLDMNRRAEIFHLDNEWVLGIDDRVSIPITHCPYCGRKLVVKRVKK